MKKIYVYQQSIMNGTVTCSTEVAAFTSRELAEEVRNDIRKENDRREYDGLRVRYGDIEKIDVYESKEEIPFYKLPKEKNNKLKNNTTMKRFEDMTIKQVKKEITRWEQNGDKSKSIDVVSIKLHPGGEVYKQGNGDTCEHFYADVVIGEEVVTNRGYEWDCDDEEISSSW